MQKTSNRRRLMGVQLAAVLYQFLQAAASFGRFWPVMSRRAWNSQLWVCESSAESSAYKGSRRAVFGLCYAEFVASRVLRTVRFRVCGVQGFCSKMAPS